MMGYHKPDVAFVVVGEPMSEKVIDSAISTMTQLTWRGLVQLIEKYRQDYALKAAAHAEANNPLGMARELGGNEALSNLVAVLAEKRPQDG